MNKSAFIKKLTEALRRLGVGEEEASRRAAQVSSFIDTLTPEEAEQALSSGMDIDAFARELLLTDFNKPDPKRKASAPAAQELPMSSASTPAPEVKSEAPKKEGVKAYRQGAPAQKDSAKKERAEILAKTGDPAQTAVAAAEREARSGAKKAHGKEKNAGASETRMAVKAEQSEKKEARGEEGDFFSKEFSITTAAMPVAAAKEDGGKGFAPKKKAQRKKSLASSARKFNATFWLLFIATLPLTLCAFLAVAAFFSLIFLFLFFIIIALVGALAAFVGLGLFAFLVGIGYGGSQMAFFGAFAAGLYEVGVGLCIGAVTLFGGIVIYNIAVRLIPRVIIKNIVNLFFFLIEKLRALFILAQEVCAKL